MMENSPPLPQSVTSTRRVMAVAAAGGQDVTYFEPQVTGHRSPRMAKGMTEWLISTRRKLCLMN